MDRPDVVILPPVLIAIALAVTLVLRFAVPLPIGPWIVCAALGLGFLAFAVAMIRSGFSAMTRAGTNVSPYEASLAIAASGAYRFSRNPIYLGMMSFLVACSLFLNTWWGIITLTPVFLTLHFGVVLREEAYLERKFGDEYRAFKSAVRRYF